MSQCCLFKKLYRYYTVVTEVANILEVLMKGKAVIVRAEVKEPGGKVNDIFIAQRRIVERDGSINNAVLMKLMFEIVELHKNKSVVSAYITSKPVPSTIRRIPA